MYTFIFLLLLGSADEAEKGTTEEPTQTEEHEQREEDDDYDEEEEEEEETITKRPRLPSFKRANRDSTEDDDPELTRMREELRSKRQGLDGENAEQNQDSQQPPGELDPGQG